MIAGNDVAHTRGGDESGAAEVIYDLTLFVSGATDLSARAVVNVKSLCETHLEGRYRLRVVDVNDTAVVVDRDIMVTPSLVKNEPLPVRTIVGDLSRIDDVRSALDLPAAMNVSSAPR